MTFEKFGECDGRTIEVPGCELNQTDKRIAPIVEHEIVGVTGLVIKLTSRDFQDY
ncbi:MAG: hypothetical protein PHH06_01140 [Candidatus Gracilibacteria bacterium]|nr:hypothetical protein [Candidatus Gracilibacteria bacterium]